MALYFNGNKVINSLVVDGSVGAVIKGKDTPLSFTGLNGQMYLQYAEGNDVFGTPDSNNPTGATISATSVYSDYYAFAGFGDNIGYGAYGSNGTLVFEFTSESYKIKTLSFVDYFDVSGGYLKANSFTFEGSNDGTNWNVLYNKTDSADVKNLVKTVNINSNTEYSKFRFVINGGSGYAGIKNVVCFDGDTDVLPIIHTFAKVNGTWQDLIGTDIEDIENISSKEKELLYSLDQSMGGAWIDTGVAVSGITAFSFVNSDTGVANWARSIATSDIPVKTGPSDVYLTVFFSSWIGKDFNIRIYNGNLYVSFNSAGSSSKEVSVYAGSLND